MQTSREMLVAEARTGAGFDAVLAYGPVLVLALVFGTLIFATGQVVQQGLVDFLIVTVLLGGGAAWMTGRADASTWGKPVELVFHLALLTLAVRFFHYALFEAHLRALQYLAVDALVIFSLGILGWRSTRASLMTRQYGWLYERTGPLTWKLRDEHGL